MTLLVAALSFFTGCAEPTPKDSGPATDDTASDTAADTATDTATDTAAPKLIGTPPEAAIDAPEFAAQNRDGAALELRRPVEGPARTFNWVEDVLPPWRHLRICAPALGFKPPAPM